MGTTRHRRANRGRAWAGALLVAAIGHSPVNRAAADDSAEQLLSQTAELLDISAEMRTDASSDHEGIRQDSQTVAGG